MQTTKKIDQKQKIANFLKKYQNYYDEFELSYILDNLDIASSTIEIPDILRQILCELNLLKKEDNVYNQFAELINDIHGLDKNIVEVGGGIIPCLSKIMALKQQKGQVTVYDPRLIEENTIPNLVLKKEKLHLKTPISNAELYVGFMPRGAEELIITKACQEKKDFIITLCCDGLSDEDTYYEDNDEFFHSLMYFASNETRKNNLGTLEKTYIKKLGEAYPVIYNKRH